ncbi:Beta-hydroxyacyl-(Acyl-carrier-protein) dehydratase FabA/FabZ [Candidatus Methylobacter favarea]|uniref:Beta-hydroxyacyl-(Acyl-carrier-protein) dehydratase FabA/FabZ n=1 Tax=Candidatus Methylobacter favarea TaxID=2707345 RepID=A0A8S0WLX6_9GAMM|nr:hotdog family protein [Candidatus Methylobacter favarea]CAA9889420.1 Beta-hydroxyacyl-(Acyl-carrier-protein) dehydratase FabA/FabZ [Candidatus Methylobacter favarea]
MDFNAIDIAELIPHSGKMVLLDRIIACDEHSLSAELTVRDDGLLGSKKAVPAWAGIEYMAQAVAAYAGVMAKKAGEPVKLGFLLGTRRYSSSVAEFKVGSRLTVRVKKVIQDDALGVFDCEIYGRIHETGQDIEAIVSANLNVYQPAHVT